MWFFTLVDELAEAKIGNSGSSGGEEDIGSLEVSVDYLLFIDGQVAIGDVSDYLEGFDFGEPALFADVLLKITILAKLSHDVNIILGHEYFDGLEDVRM